MQLSLTSNLPFVKVELQHRACRISIPNVLLDTGSSGTVFSADWVARIGIVPEPRDVLRTIRGIGGAEVVFVRRVDWLQVGDCHISDFDIEVSGTDYGFDLNGILGMDFLIRSGAVIDLRSLHLGFGAEGRLAPMRTVLEAVEAIQRKFREVGVPANIPLLNGGHFRAELVDGGVLVTNLGTQPFLPWAAFQEAVCVMARNGGRAMRGVAQAARLGEPGLPLDSIEGHVAHVVYGKQPGQWAFQRIAPIGNILIWAGICESAPGELILTLQ